MLHEFVDEAGGQDWNGSAGGYCYDGEMVDEGGDGEGHTWGTSTWENGRGEEEGSGYGQGRSGGVEYDCTCEDVGLTCGKECCGWDGKGR